jgi:hypothetical protein
MYLTEEWQARRIVMDAALEVLSDGKPHKALHITEALAQRGIMVSKRLVNSVLFSEARRYVVYDHKKFLYQLRQVSVNEIDEAIKGLPVEQLAHKHNGAAPAEENAELKARYLGRNDAYIFSSSCETDPAFFGALTKGRITQVVLNRDHPLFPSLSAALAPIESVEGKQLKDQFLEAQHTLEVLLAAWAKYENDLPNGPRRFKTEEARLEWGRNARLLLMDELDDSA